MPLFSLVLIVIMGALSCTSSRDFRETDTGAGVEEAGLQSTDFAIRVDATVELFSIIYRLAEIGQYQEMLLPAYDREVEEYFGRFRSHSTVQLAIQLSETSAINGNAPMDLAVHVSAPPELQLRSPIDQVLRDLDSRWTPEKIPELLEAVRDFAVDTDFLGFFETRQPFYESAVANLRSTLSGIDMLPWFEQFYGEAPENYVVLLGLVNGSSNYGSRVTFPDSSMEYISMLGGLDPDREGVPRYERDRFIPTIVHEFNHSYVNPLVDEHREALQPAGERIFAHLESRMSRWGYNHWYVMFYEYLVRASTIRYLAANEGGRAARANVRRDERNGFPGVGALADLLSTYESNRGTYPDLDAFFPRIIAFFDDMAEEMD